MDVPEKIKEIQSWMLDLMLNGKITREEYLEQSERLQFVASKFVQQTDDDSWEDYQATKKMLQEQMDENRRRQGWDQ